MTLNIVMLCGLISDSCYYLKRCLPPTLLLQARVPRTLDLVPPIRGLVEVANLVGPALFAHLRLLHKDFLLQLDVEYAVSTSHLCNSKLRPATTKRLGRNVVCLLTGAQTSLKTTPCFCMYRFATYSNLYTHTFLNPSGFQFVSTIYSNRFLPH